MNRQTELRKIKKALLLITEKSPKIKEFSENGILKYRKNLIFEEIVDKGRYIEGVSMNKEEVFKDLFEGSEQFIISNKGRVFELIYNEELGISEYRNSHLKIYSKSPRESKKDDKCSGPCLYNYVNVRYNNRLRIIDIGYTVRELFCAKPIAYYDSNRLFGDPIVRITEKLQTYYIDNNGTNSCSDNILYATHSDVMFKGTHLGNIRQPKGKRVTNIVFDYSGKTGKLKRIDKSIRQAGRSMGRAKGHGSAAVHTGKGRQGYIADFDGNSITCRRASTLNSSAAKMVEDSLNAGNTLIKAKASVSANGTYHF